MLYIYPETVESVRKFVNKKWPDKNKEVYCQENESAWHQNRYILITVSPRINFKVVHYEYINGYLELHLEDDYYGNTFNQRLYKYLRDNIDTESGDYLWHNWNGMKQGRLRYEYKIGDLLELADYLTKFISKIDPLIEDFLNTYYDGNNDTQKEIFTVSSIDFNKIEDGASVNINITDGTGSKVVLHTMSLKDVLSLKLKIPDYQRIYCWPQKNVEQLLDDIFIPRNHKYHLGTLILQKKGDDYDIIDGQQRTVTLALILRAMCIDNILLLKEKFDSVEAQKYIGYNRYIIEMYLDRHYPNIETRSKEAKKILDIISFDVLVLNDSSLELAYTFFSTQNARGKALTDYELLKSHHLRFIPESHEAQQRHLAKMWDKLLVKSERENGDRSVSIILGIYLYCLRKWTRKQYWYIKEPNRVKNEFEAAPTIPEIPPFGERFDFMDPIQGGTHFFAFVNAFIQHYNHFIETKQYHILWETISCSGLIEININGNDDNKKLSEGKRRTHWWYGDVIAAFLFAYYMKFGNQYLSEALTCITRIVSQLRYEKSKANKQSIMDKAGEMEIIVMINQATSPTFFLASARDIIKRLPYFDKLLTGFDAPSATYLYIDKKMRDHNLFQAICRVNRVDSEEKDFGYIIDYQDLFGAVKSAIEDYTNGAFDGYDDDDIEGLLSDRLTEGRKALEESLQAVYTMCEVIHPQTREGYFAYFVYAETTPVEDQQKECEENANKRETFYKLVSRLVRRYIDIANEMEQAGYTTEEAADIKKQVDYFNDIKDEIKLKSGDALDLKYYDPAMRQLIDNYVRAEDSEKLVDLADISFLDLIDTQGDKAIDSLPKKIKQNERSVAEILAANMRKMIISERPNNPAYFDKMSDLLNHLLQEQKDGKIQYKELIKKLIEKLKEARSTIKTKYPATIDTKGKQALYDNLGKDETLALRVHETIKANARDGFRDMDSSGLKKMKALRRAVERVLQGVEVNIDDIMQLIVAQREY